MTHIKSHIDWNEIVPLLPRAKRDDLYLEAVMLLSAQEGPRRARKAVPRRVNGAFRHWGGVGTRRLAVAGNKFKINRSAASQPVRGKRFELWQNILKSKNDLITYEGLASLCKGVDLQPQSTIAQLWSIHLLDLAEPAK